MWNGKVHIHDALATSMHIVARSSLHEATETFDLKRQVLSLESRLLAFDFTKLVLGRR
jgi:hypothetical protein